MRQTDKLLLTARHAAKACPIRIVSTAQCHALADELPAEQANWSKAQGFTGASGQFVALPGRDGAIASILYGAGDDPGTLDPFAVGALSSKLPSGKYVLADCPADTRLVTLGWLLDAYRFDRYRDVPSPAAALLCPKGVDRTDMLRMAGAVKPLRISLRHALHCPEFDDLKRRRWHDLGCSPGDEAAQHVAA